MKRYLTLLSLAAIAGCGQPPMGKVDLAGSSDGGSPDDLVMSSTKDLAMKAPTGAPCMAKAECGGTTPNCLKQLQSGEAFPDGYCTSTCQTSQNGPDGINPKCPGGTGTCIGSGTGSCYTLCTGMDGQMPCERMGYSCFNQGQPVCLPSTHSECDPDTKGSCPQDGGSLDDAGAYSGRVCARIGSDPVGACVDGCDVFAQNCPDSGGNQQGCYAGFKFGEGLCFGIAGGGKDGVACQYLNSCDPGFGCYYSGNAGACRPYCGGPNSVMCSNGKMCVKLSSSTMVMTSVVGLCGG